MAESVDITPEMEQSIIFDSSVYPEGLTPPTPSASMNHGVSGGNVPTKMHFTDEINFLKMRIEELARQAAVQPTPNQAPLPGTEADGNGRQPRPPTEWAKYEQYEDFMYRQRKEWENNVGPGYWEMMRQRNRFLGVRTRDGPWDYHYQISARNDYPRPDPFQSTHEIIKDSPDGVEPDDFDHVIDYGSRRERLRKNFEWEMDRLYLVEEIDQRQRNLVKEEKKRAELLVMVPEKDGPRAEDKAGIQVKQSGEPQEEKEVEQPAPELLRLDWYEFQRGTPIRDLEACKIHVLLGEPVVQDDLMPAFGAWFAYPGRVGQKPKNKQESAPIVASAPEEAPLPERIRIRSNILMKALAKIIGSDADSLPTQDVAGVVFLRPFKALVYCEPALRDWCEALDKKFTMPLPVTAEGDLTSSAQLPLQESAHQDSSGSAQDGSSPRATTESGQVQSEGNQEELEGEEEEEEEEEDADDAGDITESPEALKHLQCLVNFMDTVIAPKRAHLNHPQSRKVFFSDLWLLFRPGMEVIGSDGKQAYRVVHVTNARHCVMPTWKRYRSSANKLKKAAFSVTCVYIDFDGKSFGPTSRVFDFKRFEGQRDITALEVYPLHLHPLKRTDFGEAEWAEVESLTPTERSARYRQQLITRGRKFLSVAGVKHMYYAGPTIGVRDDVESQVVVDFETAFSVDDAEQQEWKPKLELLIGSQAGQPDEEDEDPCEASCCRKDVVHDDAYVDGKQRNDYITSLLPKKDTGDEQPSIAIIPRSLKELRTGPGTELTVSEDELVIMSYRVFGFVLRTRKWAKLDLSYLANIQTPQAGPIELGIAERDSTVDGETKPKTTFGRLVLDKKHKHMIVSLIAQHFRDKKMATDHQEQVDIVRGKGKGLILLLHGAPGVGKTSTAEGVAELFQKPLFQITCGDLGTTAKDVEKALETTFSLANRWDCILLLDEADVFLAQRTKEDFQRNGLVAVFLRVMEYYAGILFLTTNRVGDFDEAFTSRIHVSLYYPELSSEKTVDVFKLNLELIKERFERKGRRIDIDQMRIGSFAAQHYADHPKARWNGRQIRNACQTALALAEFEAQGNSHQAILRPDAIVTLSITHFETVRDAYLEFTSYINRLYGTDASGRAQEDRLRAIWMNDVNNLVPTGAMDKKALLRQGVRRQGHADVPSASHPATGVLPPVPTVGVQRPVAPEQHYDYIYGNQNAATSGQFDPRAIPGQGKWDASGPMEFHGRAGTGTGPQHPQPQRPLNAAGVNPGVAGQQVLYNDNNYGQYID